MIFLFVQNDTEFYRHTVGEAMAEALVVMKKMRNADSYYGISQEINNWVEDLGFDGFEQYMVTDKWGVIEDVNEIYDDYDDEEIEEDQEDEGDWLDAPEYRPGRIHEITVNKSDSLAIGRSCMFYYDEESPVLFAIIYNWPPYTRTDRKFCYPSVEEKLRAKADLERYCTEKGIEWRRKLPKKNIRNAYLDGFKLIDEEDPIDLTTLLV